MWRPSPEIGPQRAAKSYNFTKFPPIVFVHLARFTYDAKSNSRKKLNTHFSFPDQINLGKFIRCTDKSQKQADDDVYVLASILVHSGGSGSGHYVAYIKLSLAGKCKWVRFDDSRWTAQKRNLFINTCFSIEIVDKRKFCLFCIERVTTWPISGMLEDRIEIWAKVY
mmetsp:Transcript_23488/g.32787  ORF Transcript_23488/g.32787 Transcript_23488/m.32787 type:complete len:167 (-) Transcript_23488:2595-3095(-)